VSICPTPSKHPHSDEEKARKHLAALRRKDGAWHMGVYHCRCGAWHVGHSGAKWGRAIRAALRAGSANAAASRRRRTR
jgi:hypothetical protein